MIAVSWILARAATWLSRVGRVRAAAKPRRVVLERAVNLVSGAHLWAALPIFPRRKVRIAYGRASSAAMAMTILASLGSPSFAWAASGSTRRPFLRLAVARVVRRLAEPAVQSAAARPGKRARAGRPAQVPVGSAAHLS